VVEMEPTRSKPVPNPVLPRLLADVKRSVLRPQGRRDSS